MKFILLIVTSFLTTLSAIGQTDQQARDLLEKTSKKMQSYATLSARFVFTMENKKMNIHEENSGSLLMKGKKYQVKLPDLGMEVFSDGKTVWNFMEMANQVMVSNVGDDSQGVIDPSAIFNVYQEGYTYKFIEEKNEAGRVISYVDLIPQDRNAEFTKIAVGIDKARLMVNSLVTHGKDGNMYGIYVREFKTDQVIDDKEFVFDKSRHRDLEEIDFR
jgi:outer membrane lipoprotein-sorting protein